MSAVSKPGGVNEPSGSLPASAAGGPVVSASATNELGGRVADTLSRPPAMAVSAASKPGGVNEPSGSLPASAAGCPLLSVAAAPAMVDYSWLAQEQRSCAATQAAATSSSLTVRPFEVEGIPLLCDVSSGAVRPLVALPCRRAVFLAIHSIAHPGVRASRRLLASRFVWPGMAADIAAWCRECQDCA